MTEISFGVIGDGKNGLDIARGLAEWGHRVFFVESRERQWEETRVAMGERSDVNFARLSEVAFLDYVVLCVESDHPKDVWRTVQTIEDDLSDDAGLILSGTVPIGLGDATQHWFRQRKKKVSVISFPLSSSPNASRKQFRSPTRFILGGESRHRKMILLRRLLSKRGAPIFVTTRKNAEMIHYASQSFLAASASLMSQLARLCEQVGADVQTIARGMGMDRRIGQALLETGVGVGEDASQDLTSFVEYGRSLQIDMSLFDAAREELMRQPYWAIDQLTRVFHSLEGKEIAIWGEFEQGARAASVILERALELGATLRVYDPSGNRKRTEVDKGGRVIWRSDPWSAIRSADALIILTASPEMREINLFELKKQLGKDARVIDGRNLYPVKMMKEIGVHYISIGRQAR